MKRPLRIGVFGGSFDPIHTGHLRIARAAERQLGLDRVLFIPTWHSPLKRRGHREHALHRMRMVRSAIKGRSAWKAEAMELRRRGLSYTIVTLKTLRRKHPNAALFLIIGSDNLASFTKWREPERVAALSQIVVYRRPGYPATLSGLKRWNARLLRGPVMSISSTDIRDRFRRGKSVNGLVPKEVRLMATRLRLYSSPRRTARQPIGH